MYKRLNELRKRVPENDFNRWAIEMLSFIANNEGWEESETKYFTTFFIWILDNDK